MFEGVGRTADRDQRKREATSVALTTLLCAAGAGFWMGVAAWQLSEPIATLVEDAPMVELVLAEPEVDRTLPDAPPAPARIQKGEPDPTPTPEPDPDAAPEKLVEPPSTEMRSNTGDPDGTADGDPEGTPDGDPQGTGTEPGATDGALAIHSV